MDEPRPFFRDPKIQAILVVLFAALLYLFTLGRQGAAREVLLSGGYAYVSVGNDGGVRVLSLQNPAIPAEVGSFDTPGSALKMALQGSLLYVADGERGLRILDISNPRVPMEIGALEFTGETVDVSVAGHSAYLARGRDGVAVVDISNPSAPLWVHQMDTLGEAKALTAAEVTLSTPGVEQQIQATFLYIAEGEAGIGIYEFLNPQQPAPLSSFDTPGDAMDLHLSGPYVFVADGRTGIQIINVSNPVAPTLVGAYDQGSNALALEVAGNRAYFSEGSRGLTEINVGNPQAPVFVTRVDTPGDTAAVAVADFLVYVADGSQGLRVYNLSAPQTPRLVGWVETPGEASFGQLLSGILAITRGQGSILSTKILRTALLLSFDLSLFLIVLYFWLAFYAQFTLPVRGLAERRKVISRLITYLTGGHGLAITIKDGKVIQRAREERRRGPGVALFDTASAGVFRDHHMFTKVAGPGVVFTDRREYLAGTVDLHPQALSFGPREGEDPYAPRLTDETQGEYEARQRRRFETSGLTLDGVEVVPNISVVFRLDSPPGEGKTQFGFRPESVHRAVAGEAVNPDADASSSDRRVPWTWLPLRIAADLWREYLRKYPLDDLFTLTYSPEHLLSSDERKTAFDWIVEMVRNRMLNPEVEELDESGKPTGEKKPSKEYALLEERGIQILAVEIRNLRFPKVVETRLVEQWQATWLQRAQQESRDIDRLLTKVKGSGQELALKEFAVAASQQLGRSLLQRTSQATTEIDLCESLERMVDGSLRLCIHENDLQPHLTNQRSSLVEIIEWIRKQGNPTS